MKAMYLGEVVRRQRKALGVTQEMVCEGLCTTMTLSRFESGRQTPSRDCVVAILQRLGLQDDWYYAQLTRAEMRLMRLKQEILAYCNQFEHSLGSNRQQARIKALEKICELEHYIKPDDRINQQFILGQKTTVEVHSPQTQLEMLMQAIRLTSPRFDLEELRNCLYSADEVAIINKIAVRYALCGQRRKAVEIYEQLMKLVQKQTLSHSCLTLIAYNYALYLTKEKQLEEALEVSKLGRQACIRQGNYSVLPEFLHIEAECYYLMGKLDRSMESYRSAYYIYGATMNHRNQEILKAAIKERFNLIL